MQGVTGGTGAFLVVCRARSVLCDVGEMPESTLKGVTFSDEPVMGTAVCDKDQSALKQGRQVFATLSRSTSLTARHGRSRLNSGHECPSRPFRKMKLPLLLEAS